MTFQKLTKIILASLFVCLCYNLSSAQSSDSTFVRKGRILIETGYGYSLGGGVYGGGSGLSILFDENNSLTTIGVEGGYFLSEDFAIKLKVGILDGGFSSIKSVGAGIKQYFLGNAFAEFGGTRLSGFGNSEYFANISMGGGFRLADNINLEPSLGIVLQDEGNFMKFGFNFAMFL